MDSSFLHKRIQQRAENLFSKDLEKIDNLLNKSFLGRVEIELQGGAKTTLGALFGNENYLNLLKGYAEQRKAAIEYYEKEESDKILKGLAGLDYLFNQE